MRAPVTSREVRRAVITRRCFEILFLAIVAGALLLASCARPMLPRIVTRAGSEGVCPAGYRFLYTDHEITAKNPRDSSRLLIARAVCARIDSAGAR